MPCLPLVCNICKSLGTDERHSSIKLLSWLTGYTILKPEDKVGRSLSGHLVCQEPMPPYWDEEFNLEDAIEGAGVSSSHI